jgi:hypothetical protein
MTSSELKDRAERYCQLAVNVTDKQAVHALLELAKKYKAMAAKLEAEGDSSVES